MPWAFKDHQGREKGLLRTAMESLLPAEILHRKKSPYPKTWDPRYQKLVGEKLQKVVEEKEAPLWNLVRREAVAALFQEEYAHPWYGQLMRKPQTMAYLLQIDEWLRRYQVTMLF